MLVGLSPCSAGSTSTNCKSAFDTVSLFTFPNIQANEASDDTSMPDEQSRDSGVLYTGAGGNVERTHRYLADLPGDEFSGQLPEYQPERRIRKHQLGTRHRNRGIYFEELQWIANSGRRWNVLCRRNLCSGIRTSRRTEGESEFQNALIILSDGASNTTKMTATNGETLTTTGVYPSLNDQCQQGVTAAQYVAAQPNTTVYTVAYGASTSSGQCTTDPTLTPCAAMLAMASSASDFYSDATALANNGSVHLRRQPEPESESDFRFDL